MSRKLIRIASAFALLWASNVFAAGITLSNSYATGGVPVSVKLAGSYMFMGENGDGLEVAKNTDAWDYESTYLASDHGGADNFYGMDQDGTNVFIANGNGGLEVVSIAASPAFVGRVTFAGARAANCCTIGGTAYVAVACDATSNRKLQMIDVHAPGSPTIAGTYAFPGTHHPAGVWVNGNFAYVADGANGLQVIDVHDPANPAFSWSVNPGGNAYKVVVSGNYAYLADGATGVVAVNINTHAADRTFNTDGTAYAVKIDADNHKCYVADGTNGLEILDISLDGGGVPKMVLADVNGYNTGGLDYERVDISGTTVYCSDPTNLDVDVLDAGSLVYPIITTNPTPTLAFGDVKVSTTKHADLAISNTGNADLHITGISITAGGANFSTTNPGDTTIHAGATGHHDVTITPTGTGALSANLRIVSDDPANLNLDVALTGNGIVPDISVDHDPIAFGDVKIQTLSNINLTITNLGAADLYVSSASITNSAGGVFSVADFGAPFTLAHGASNTKAVSFTPTATGLSSGNLRILSDSPGETQLDIPISGTGVRPTIAFYRNVALDPFLNPTAFGNVPVNATSATNLIIKNTGTVALVVTNVYISTAEGVYSTNFDALYDGDTLLLAANAMSDGLQVTFTPSNKVAYNSGNVRITSDASNTPTMNVTLTGAGVTSDVTYSLARSKWRMIGIPVNVSYGDAYDLFKSDLNNQNVGNATWRLSRWSVADQTYIRYQEADYPTDVGKNPPALAPGLGYWIKQVILDNPTLTITAAQSNGQVPQNQRFSVTLESQGAHAGMNMVANPFGYNYDLQNTSVYDHTSGYSSLVDAAGAGLVNGHAYRWNPDHVGNDPAGYVPLDFTAGAVNISAWEGVWIVVTTTDVLDLRFAPAGFTGGLAPRPPAANEDEGWALNLVAATAENDYGDVYNRAAVNADALEGYDSQDAFEFTPMSDSYVQLFFPHPDFEGALAGNYTYDYRSMDFAQPKVWDFTVQTWALRGRQIVLRWPNIADINNAYTFRLSNLETGEEVASMRQDGIYTFTANDTSDLCVTHFRLTAAYNPQGVGKEIQPGQIGLVSLFPNPFNNVVSVEYYLASSANVSLKVLDLQGREVAVLQKGYQPAGTYKVTWDGAHMASGLYLIQLNYAGVATTRRVLLLR